MPIQGLFATSTGLIDFVIIEEELQQFATYAEAINTFSLQKLNELKEEFADYEVDWEGGEKVLRWKRNARFVTPATLLVTSYVLFEKSLKNLCYSFTKGKQDYQIPIGDRFKVKPRENESAINAQLRYLRQHCEFEFVLSDDESRMIDASRRVRNAYAHGDWEMVKALLQGIDLMEVLRVISNIFRKIEDGMP